MPSMTPCHRAQAPKDFKDFLKVKNPGTWEDVSFHRKSLEVFK